MMRLLVDFDTVLLFLAFKTGSSSPLLTSSFLLLFCIDLMGEDTRALLVGTFAKDGIDLLVKGDEFMIFPELSYSEVKGVDCGVEFTFSLSKSDLRGDVCGLKNAMSDSCFILLLPECLGGALACGVAILPMETMLVRVEITRYALFLNRENRRRLKVSRGGERER